MAHPSEDGERTGPPPEVSDALKVVAQYYKIEPEELEGLLDSIAPLLNDD
jgi:hypothetical protein